MDKSTILEIYEYIEMNKKTTKEYRKLANIFGAKREEFEKTLIDKQKEDLEELLMSMENMDGKSIR